MAVRLQEKTTQSAVELTFLGLTAKLSMRTALPNIGTLIAVLSSKASLLTFLRALDTENLGHSSLSRDHRTLSTFQFSMHADIEIILAPSLAC